MKMQVLEKIRTGAANFADRAKVATVIAIGTAATSSQAAAIDVTAVVTDIAAQAAPIGLVGGAVLIIVAAVKAFKWVRAAMS